MGMGLSQLPIQLLDKVRTLFSLSLSLLGCRWAVLADRAKSAGNVRVVSIRTGTARELGASAMETGQFSAVVWKRREKGRDVVCATCRNWAGLCARVPRGEPDDSSENLTGHTHSWPRVTAQCDRLQTGSL